MTSSPPVGLIAILRGLTPSEAPVIGDALYQAGIRRADAPRISPEPLESIGLLVERRPADALVGAGTVVVPADVDRVHEAGGRMVVAPNTDPAVITRTVELGMAPHPGVATATEVFTALHAGARALKIFPAPAIGIAGMKAWAATVPPGTPFLPVVGIDADTRPAWLAAGAAGAGSGTPLYAAGRGAEDGRTTAATLQRLWDRHHREEEHAGRSPPSPPTRPRPAGPS